MDLVYFGSDKDVFESPLPLAGCGSRLTSLAVRNFEIPRYRSVSRNASLRAACGRACVGSLRERSAPFDFPPEKGWSASYRLTKHDGPTRRDELLRLGDGGPVVAMTSDYPR